MNEQELMLFLNKTVKVMFDIGYNRNFVYIGKLTDVNAENICMLDRKVGQLLLCNDRILSIEEVKNNGEGYR